MDTPRCLPFPLLAALLVAMLAQPILAGTAAAPEVVDDRYDVTTLGTGVGCATQTAAPAAPAGACLPPETGLDLLSAWVNETATNVTFFVTTASGGVNGYSTVDYVVHFMVGNTSYVAGLHAEVAQVNDGVPGTGVVTPTGVAKTASFVTGGEKIVVPRTALGAPDVGAMVTKLYVTSAGNLLGKVASAFADRAPNAPGFGRDFAFTMETASLCTFKAGETNMTDKDRDCLPDFWERLFFTGTTAQNATGDPDNDGCSNQCEYLAGRDPTLADPPCVFKVGETNQTDGDRDCLPDYWELHYFGNATAAIAAGDPDEDGCDNRCEYLAGTDPTVSNLPRPNGGPAPLPPTQTSTKVVTIPTGDVAASSDPPVGELSALEMVKADAGYAVASAAAMGAIVIISLLGLFARWGA
ncbi:MAG TPA: hypothetical protein VM286_03990 [Candidatus Thermoplasmatota archaeon]|nr:hypothetical protein [Candidatus Thermoplasmatota archaeon]